MQNDDIDNSSPYTTFERSLMTAIETVRDVKSNDSANLMNTILSYENLREMYEKAIATDNPIMERATKDKSLPSTRSVEELQNSNRTIIQTQNIIILLNVLKDELSVEDIRAALNACQNFFEGLLGIMFIDSSEKGQFVETVNAIVKKFIKIKERISEDHSKLSMISPCNGKVSKNICSLATSEIQNMMIQTQRLTEKVNKQTRMINRLFGVIKNSKYSIDWNTADQKNSDMKETGMNNMKKAHSSDILNEIGLNRKNSRKKLIEETMNHPNKIKPEVSSKQCNEKSAAQPNNLSLPRTININKQHPQFIRTAFSDNNSDKSDCDLNRNIVFSDFETLKPYEVSHSPPANADNNAGMAISEQEHTKETLNTTTAVNGNTATENASSGKKHNASSYKANYNMGPQLVPKLSNNATNINASAQKSPRVLPRNLHVTSECAYDPQTYNMQNGNRTSKTRKRLSICPICTLRFDSSFSIAEIRFHINACIEAEQARLQNISSLTSNVKQCPFCLTTFRNDIPHGFRTQHVLSHLNDTEQSIVVLEANQI